MGDKLKGALALGVAGVLASKTYPVEVGAVMNTVSSGINAALTAVTPYAASAAPFAGAAAAAAIPGYLVGKKWGKIAGLGAGVAGLGFLTGGALLPGLATYGLSGMAGGIGNSVDGKITSTAVTALTYGVLASNPAFMLGGLGLYGANKLLIPGIKAGAQKMQNVASWTYAKTLGRFKSSTPSVST